MFKIISAILFIIMLTNINIIAGGNQLQNGQSTSSAALDLDDLCKQVYKLYNTDEVAAKKEILVYKKLNELIGTSQTVKFTTTDSISYDKKTDYSSIKSKEIYYADNAAGYFGVFVLVSKKGDDLLMNSSPDKEMTVTGKVTDILVVSYIKNNKNEKAYTSIKDFDDKGTVIQQIILKIEM